MSNKKRLKGNLSNLTRKTAQIRSESRPGEAACVGADLPGPGAINGYHCPQCEFDMVVIHVDKGVTPMFKTCETPKCGGQAHSMGYPKNPSDKIKESVWYEWYRPTRKEFSKLSNEMKQFVAHGGLVWRKKAKVNG